MRIYAGADGSFTLYEDENDNYDYEKGVHTTISLQWDDVKRTLTIGEREGKFPGMLETRAFHIVVVSEGHGVGIEPTAQADKLVESGGATALPCIQRMAGRAAGGADGGVRQREHHLYWGGA